MGGPGIAGVHRKAGAANQGAGFPFIQAQEEGRALLQLLGIIKQQVSVGQNLAVHIFLAAPGVSAGLAAQENGVRRRLLIQGLGHQHPPVHSETGIHIPAQINQLAGFQIHNAVVAEQISRSAVYHGIAVSFLVRKQLTQGADGEILLQGQHFPITAVPGGGIAQNHSVLADVIFFAIQGKYP